MLHTGTGNDQQASDDFLALYELHTPLPVEPGYQSYPITSPFRLTAHATIAIGLLITSRASCVTLCCELESSSLQSHKGTQDGAPYSPAAEKGCVSGYCTVRLAFIPAFIVCSRAARTALRS